jgi:hypothetical protein
VPPLGTEMPVSTEQVLHPERFAPDTRDMPTAVTFREPLPAEWTEVLTDGLGELETRLLLREHLDDRESADRAAAGWDGDRFRLLDGPEGEFLLWVTVWDTERDAEEFEVGVRLALASRYGGSPEAAGRAVTVRRTSRAGTPVVLVTDIPAGADGPGDLPSGADRFELEAVTR